MENLKVTTNNEMVMKGLEDVTRVLDFKFVNKSRFYYAKKKRERELNDILEVIKVNGEYYRIYLNKFNHYTEVPKDEIMLNELKCRTWTLDNKEKNSKLVKSNSEAGDTIYLSEILERYGYESYEYKVNPNIIEFSGIHGKAYNKRRKEYKEF